MGEGMVANGLSHSSPATADACAPLAMVSAGVTVGQPVLPGPHALTEAPANDRDPAANIRVVFPIPPTSTSRSGCHSRLKDFQAGTM